MNDEGTPRSFEFGKDAALAGIPVGFLVLEGFECTATAPEFNGLREAYLAELCATTTLEAILADPRLDAYQRLHAAIGRTGRQFTPSPESLFRALFKRGIAPPIHPLVDLYNHVSMTQRISIGAHDLAKLVPPVRLVQFAAPARFLPMGGTKEVTVGAGEYGYVDGAGRVLCRLDCRQAGFSRITDATRNPLLVIQGNPELGVEAIAAAAAALEQLVQRYCGGFVRSALTLLP